MSGFLESWRFFGWCRGRARSLVRARFSPRPGSFWSLVRVLAPERNTEFFVGCWWRVWYMLLMLLMLLAPSGRTFLEFTLSLDYSIYGFVDITCVDAFVFRFLSLLEVISLVMNLPASLILVRVMS